MNSDRQQPTLVRRLVGGGMWVLVGRIAGIGLTFVSNVVLARWLSPAEFGQFLMVVSFIGFLSILGRFGLDRILIRFVSEGLGSQNAILVKRTLQHSFSAGLLSGLCVGVLAILILGSLRAVLDLPTSVLLWVGVAVPLFTLLHLVAESFRGFHQFRYASFFQAQSGPLTTLLFVAALLVIVWMRPSLSSAVTCYVLSVACILPCGIVYLMRTVRRSLPTQQIATHDKSSPLSLSRLLSLCMPIAISDTLGFLAISAGLWIVAVCCSSDDLALFGAARQIAMLLGLPLQLINMTVMSTIPELHAQRNFAKLQRLLQISATMATIPTVLLVLIIVIWPAWVLETVFGSFYGDAAQILIILSLPRLVSAWTGSCLNTLLLTGRQNLVATLNVLLVVALLGLGPIFGLKYGAMGVALVSAGVMTTINLLAWIIAKVQVGVWTHATFRLSRLVRDDRP